MQTYKELIQNLELNEVNGNELKKWFGNMGVKVKASKVGSKFLNAKSDVEFPNEFRLHVVDKFFSLKDVKDKKNVNYGNIETKSITLTPAQWDDLLNESVQIVSENVKELEEAPPPQWNKQKQSAAFKDMFGSKGAKMEKDISNLAPIMHHKLVHKYLGLGGWDAGSSGSAQYTLNSHGLRATKAIGVSFLNGKVTAKDVTNALAKMKKDGLIESTSDNLKGWIAIFNGKELEITLKDAGSLYDAKKFAIKALKVPKSKVGLLAIAPAY